MLLDRTIAFLAEWLPPSRRGPVPLSTCLAALLYNALGALWGLLLAALSPVLSAH